MKNNPFFLNPDTIATKATFCGLFISELYVLHIIAFFLVQLFDKL